MADTHIGGGRRRRLPDAVYDLLNTADAVLHAGDIVAPALLDELAAFAPTHAVLGNNDGGELAGVLGETWTGALGGVRLAMIHDSGPTAGRAARMQRRFPEADIVVYGHSHVPFDGEGLGGQRLFNPGSPTERRSQPHHTIGIITTSDAGFSTEIRLLD